MEAASGCRLTRHILCRERGTMDIRYSVNPYNVNSAALAAAIAILKREKYRKKCSETIISTREWTKNALASLGFEMTPSLSNFIFVRHSKIKGEELYKKLKEHGILIRHFSLTRIQDYNRISIGSLADMKRLVKEIKNILESL